MRKRGTIIQLYSDRSYFRSFFARVHCWYPFLDPAFCIQQYSRVQLFADRNTNYCLFLLMMTLGMMAENDEIKYGQKDCGRFAQFAFEMLSEVSHSDTLEAVQCLILVRYQLPESFN